MRPVVHVFQIYTMSGDDIVWWHLSSSNGRRLARCALPFTSTAQARASIAAVVPQLSRATATVRPTPANRWRWMLALDGSPVVLGSGDQDRRVRCENAWRLFVAAAPLAVVDPAVHTFRGRDSGRTPQVIA